MKIVWLEGLGLGKLEAPDHRLNNYYIIDIEECRYQYYHMATSLWSEWEDFPTDVDTPEKKRTFAETMWRMQ